MRKNIFVLSVLVAVMSLSFATLGVTVFTADRTATIGVTNDAQGMLALDAATGQPFVSNTNGTLEINVSQASASGVNKNATLELGDVSGAPGTYGVGANGGAFNVTNQFGSTVDVTATYTPNTVSGNANVTIIFDDGTTTKTLVADGTGSNNQVSFTGVADGTTIDVAVVVHTDSAQTTDDLGGTLTFKAQQ